MSEVIKKAATNEVVEFLYGDLRERSAPVIFNSATGNPVVFNDGANGLPVKSLKVNFSPIQNGSGDPSPENIRSIVPWNGLTVWNSGKNLISTGTVEFTRAKKYYFDKVFPAGTYTLSALVTSTDIDDSRCLARFWMNEDPVGSDIYFTRDSRKSKTIAIEQPFNSIYLYASHSYIDADGDTASFADMQLEVGSIATDYEPYHSIAETDIEFSSSVYGGTLDVVSGVLMVNWGVITKNTAEMNNNEEYPGWRNTLPRDWTGSINGNIIGSFSNISPLDNGWILGKTNLDDPGTLMLNREKFGKTQSEWIALALDVQVVIPLITPYMVQLAPTQLQTLLGANTIWSDANGNVEVEYRADTNKFINKFIVDAIANQPHAANGGVYGIMTPGAGLSILNDKLITNPASVALIKSGTSSNAPVTPLFVHAGAFYGLARAAGVDMAESSNAVGTYTDPAKTAIQKMFGFDGILGDYELSTTASKAYAIGETFIFNGNRYRATTAIAINDVLAPGTNCVLDPIDGHYVRDTDYATSDHFGVIKVGNGLAVNNNGTLRVRFAVENETKAGNVLTYSISTGLQHYATFYGLAKAAGDSTQSQSDNAVGTYTAEAKTAIQTMLGIEADIPLVETVTGSTVSITGMPNVRYICETAISELTITPPASGSIVVRFTAGSNCIVSLPQTVKLPAWFDISSLEDGTTYEIIITDGVYGGVMSWA